MLSLGKRGQSACVVIAILFVMTGIAIVVYLNQSPGEPRERDYSFLGSYMAYAAWIGFGAMALSAAFASIAARITMRKDPSARNKAVKFGYAIGGLLAFGVPVLMLQQNYDDHDRSGRRAASNLSANLLNSLEKDAIIFVDGDNYTFPLWYAQEVEGIRKDVKVINMAYLSLPQYAAMMMRDWEGNKGIPTVFRPEDIIYNAFLFPAIADNASDTVVPAGDMIRELRAGKDFNIDVRKVSLPIGNDTVRIPLSQISTSGTGKIMNFRKLMILNILAANAESESPRPIYWHRALPTRYMIGLQAFTSPSFAGRKLGKLSSSEIAKDMDETLQILKAPNSPGDVYMDGTPAGQVSAQRASLIIIARELLRNGNIETAKATTEAALSLMGSDQRTFGGALDADTTFITRKELGYLLRELADSISIPTKPSHYNPALSQSLQHKGDSLLDAHKRDLNNWTRYKRALPPRLRTKMSR